jgi:mannose-6-phosphate isomerase-like protein (cupin superfamily)
MLIVNKAKPTGKPVVSPLGMVLYELIGRDPDHGGTEHHSLAIVQIPTGKASEPPHYHKLAEETYYVLTGEGRMVVENRPTQLKPGMACLILPGEVHQIFSEGKEGLEILVICAPAWRPDDSYYNV